MNGGVSYNRLLMTYVFLNIYRMLAAVVVESKGLAGELRDIYIFHVYLCYDAVKAIDRF